MSRALAPLSATHRLPGGSWRCRPGTDPALLVAATAALHDATLVPEAAWLKRGRRRLVFRVGTGPTAVVKGHPLERLRHRLLWHGRYGPREATNLALAADRGLPVPRLLALGRHRKGPAVEWGAILMEDLGSRPSLEAALRRARGDLRGQRALLARGGALLERLHRAAVVHADPSGQSFLLGEAGDDDRICDLQYVGFHRAASAAGLAFQVAYLADTVQELVPPAELEAWGTATIARVTGEDAAAAGRRLRRWRGRRLSRSARIALRG